jgi:choline dehydrogenase-like flavoprotein
VAHYDRVIAHRPNYHILTDTTVSKVLFHGTTAVGVEYLPSAGGQRSTVLASKEVIVAAGALHTPQLLQLSGIGAKSLLHKLNIPVISDLPGVGSNLQDQTTFNVPYNCELSSFVLVALSLVYLHAP